MENLYRRCVGTVVFYKGKVLLCERLDTPGAWQFPQGGAEPGEDTETTARRELREETSIIETTARRELREETSIISVKTEAVIDTPLRYDFPPEVKKKSKWQYAGQEMRWVLFRFCGDEKEINLATENPEFSRYAWEDIDEAVKRIVDFKKNVYTEAVKIFKPLVER